MKKYAAIVVSLLMGLLSGCKTVPSEFPTESSEQTTTQICSISEGISFTSTVSQSLDDVYTLFPSTTRMTKGIQHSFEGVSIGKTTLDEAQKMLAKKNLAFDYEELFPYSILTQAISTEGAYYMFDDKGITREISVSDGSTERGAKIGDSEERIIELYGDGFQKWLNGSMIYENGIQKGFRGEIMLEYTDGSVFLAFAFGDNNQLHNWWISQETMWRPLD